MIRIMKTCDHEPTLVYSTANANYYACDEDNVVLFEGQLIVNFSGNPGVKAGSNVWKIPTLAKHMVKGPEELTIVWRDFGSPPVKSSFWNALDDYVGTKKYKDVLFHCEHGHGRTGTGTCAMMVAKGMKAEDAIKRLRKEYCPQVVESPAQAYYLLALDEELNGRTLPEDEADIADMVHELVAPVMSILRRKSNLSKFSDHDPE
jgi:Protein-tyrosine phosphatase